MAITKSDLLGLANNAALKIERASEENGVTYSAAQTFYGVEVEALVGENWIRASNLEDGVEIEAVRFFDCDGNRGAECRTAEEIEAELSNWIG